MKVLVTGNAGYVGDAVVEYLQHATHNVVGVDKLMYTPSYNRRGITFHKLDILTDDFFKLLDDYDPDAIIHLAGIVGDGACQANPELTLNTNELFVKRLVEKIKPKVKLVFISTCSVFGANNDLLNEESPTNPLSLYAGTKLNAEEYVRSHPNHVIFRLGTLFGMSSEHARIRSDLVVNILTFKACENSPLTVFGGEQWRPLIHVMDVGRIIASSIDLDEGELTGTYIASNGNYRVVDIADKLQDVFGGKLDIKVTDMKFEDLRNYKVDNSKLKKKMGYSQTMRSLKFGINDMREQYGSMKTPWNIAFNNARYHNEVLNVRPIY